MQLIDNLNHLLMTSGTLWVLWSLLFLSTLSLAIALERYLTLRRGRAPLSALRAALDRHLSTGDIPAALSALSELPSPAADIASAGLRLAHLGPQAAEKAMSGALIVNRNALEKRLSILGTIGNNAPFLGLLGTVIGIIEAFAALGTDGLASDTLMGAISEALVATAIGIAVALPAVAFNNLLRRRVQHLLSESRALAHLTLAYLHGVPAHV